MPTFSGGIIYSASPQHLSWRGHVPPVPPVSYARVQDTFGLSFSRLVDENLQNFSCSFSHLLVLVTQVSHQNECDDTR